MEKALESSPNSESLIDTCSSDEVVKASFDEYGQLQWRLIKATLILSTLAVAITALLFDLSTASSLLVGALSGVLYLRLLARSIGKLGQNSRKVSKVQLLVPIVLVLAISRLPQLDLLPAILGFLLYKPSLLLQVLLDLRIRPEPS